MNLPERLYIQANQRCNLKCVHCTLHRNQVCITEQELDDKLHIIGEFAALNPDGLVDICQRGEPLLDPYFFILLEACQKNDLKMQTTLNGTMVNDQVAKLLLEYPKLKIHISLDSIDPEVHDRQRGMKGTWEFATRAIKFLRCHVSCLITKDLNQAEFTQFVTKLGAKGVTFNPVQPRFGDANAWVNPSSDPFYQEHNSVKPKVCTKYKRDIVVDHHNNLNFCFDPSKLKPIKYTRGCLNTFWCNTDRSKFKGCKMPCSWGCP